MTPVFYFPPLIDFRKPFASSKKDWGATVHLCLVEGYKECYLWPQMITIDHLNDHLWLTMNKSDIRIHSAVKIIANKVQERE